MEKTRVAVFISGTGSNMAALLYAQQEADCPYEVALVMSNEPEAAGLKLARAEGVETQALPHAGLSRAEHEAQLQAALVAARVDYIALAGYMRILTADFVKQWEGRILNIHPSLLPAYKGLDCHARALADGVSHSGCTVHEVTAELDSGPILGQIKVAVLSDDTVESLAARVHIAEHKLYSRILIEYLGELSNIVRLARPIHQDTRASRPALPIERSIIPAFTIHQNSTTPGTAAMVVSK